MVYKYFNYDFKGLGNAASRCGIMLFWNGQDACIVFIELDKNPGTSVTNASEQLATLVHSLFKLNMPPHTKYFELCEHEAKAGTLQRVDEITYTWGLSKSGLVFGSPQWKPLGIADFKAYLRVTFGVQFDSELFNNPKPLQC